MVKIKSTPKEELSVASGERSSIKPAQVLAFPATRGKAASCLMNVPRKSSPQQEEDSRTNADLSLSPFPAEPPSSRITIGCNLNVCMPPPAGGHCHCTQQYPGHSGWARLLTQACPTQAPHFQGAAGQGLAPGAPRFPCGQLKTELVSKE